MTKRVYEQYDAATQYISAYCILHQGEFIGKIAFTRTRSNLRVTCYFQIFGLPMVKGIANGGGYDRATAAIEMATDKYMDDRNTPEGHKPECLTHAVILRDTLKIAEGMKHWDAALRERGYQIHQAV